MENLVSDLQNAIWRKFGENSASSAFTPCGEEDAANIPSDSQAQQKTAVLGRTVCYIVSAVVLNKGRVLMMREAKKSCRGLWYLPAGRVENNESLEEGVIREVLEETGLTFQPTSIVCIDSQGTFWFRFTFVGSITGGKLKSLKEEDKESMEAGWFTPQEVFSTLTLRGEDICPLINTGLKWYETKQEHAICRLMPAKNSHGHVVRLLAVKRQERNNNKYISCLLFHSDDNSHPCFPYKDLFHFSNVTNAIDGLIRDFDSDIQYRTHGFINVEHTGKPHGIADGLRLTVLVEVFVPVEQGILNGKYKWFELEEKCLADKIWKLIDVEGCAEFVAQ